METARPPGAWTGFVDDARPFLPGQPPLGPLVGARVLADTDLPLARGHQGPVRALVGGGAGQLAGPIGLCARIGLDLVALEVGLRDLDDPVGNARRVVAALAGLDGGGVGEAPPPVFVRVDGVPTSGWLAAADELAAAELALTIPLDGDVPAWVDAALDRELPFSLTGGTVDEAVAALRTTARLWGDADDLVAARRWCRSWTCPDPASALARLEAE